MNSNKLKYILSIHFFILSIILSAQFVITESFKNSVINEISEGGAFNLLPNKENSDLLRMDKEEVLTSQKADDGLKIEKSTTTTQIKNGELITYTINVINSTTSIAKVDFLDYFLKNDLKTIYGKDAIEYSTWTLTNFQSNYSTQFTVDNTNKLGGALFLEANKTGVITVTAKIKNVNEITFNSKTTAYASNISDEILTNNEKVVSIPVTLTNPDLAVSSVVVNPNTYIEDNIITVRLTNTGTTEITSTADQIKVNFNIPNTSLTGLLSNHIISVNSGLFTSTSSFNLDISR